MPNPTKVECVFGDRVVHRFQNKADAAFAVGQGFTLRDGSFVIARVDVTDDKAALMLVPQTFCAKCKGATVTPSLAKPCKCGT